MCGQSYAGMDILYRKFGEDGGIELEVCPHGIIVVDNVGADSLNQMEEAFVRALKEE